MAGTLTPAIFRGCTNAVAGTTGIVPAPFAGQTNAFLRGDGVWASPALNGFVSGPNASTDGTIAVFAGVAGNVIRDTGVSIDLTNNITGVAALTCSSIQVTGLASGIVHSDGSGNFTSSAVSLTADVSGILPIANGGTNANTQTAAFDNLSPLTTKGDLIVFDGTHNIRVGVGTDGQVLQANSGAAAGVSWTTNPAGAYDTIENAGVALTQRNTLNFSGSGITAVDNAGATRTDVSLAGTLVDVAGLTPTNNTVVYGNGTHFTNASTLITNVYNVAKNGNDATGDGSENFPFLTVSAAMTAIGSAANSAAFNDATKEYYVINIWPGTYTETVTVPNRPYLLFNLYGSQIVGNVTQNFDGTLFGGVLTTAKVIFQGHDVIGLHTGLSAPKNAIVGNVTCNRTAGAFNFNAYEFIDIGVNGNIVADGAVAYTLLLYVSESNVSGAITANQATININLYAENCNTPGTTGIGSTAGPGTITLRNIRNVAFAGAVVTKGATAGFIWDNITFNGGDFTGLTSVITTDSASYQNYLSNVTTKGSETFVFRDSAKGINSQYVPTNYTATTTQVTGALTGIDTALGNKQPLNASLTALAALASTGFIAQTGAHTFADRTITGTAGTITITNGDGVAGNPTITIDATYIGQTSITTLGTVTTGTWNGSVVGAQYGGTGVASPTAHGIMVAEGASAMVSKVLTNGQLLIGSTGADPVAATITAGSGISVTNSAGGITIAATGSGGGGLAWNDVVGTSATMAAGNGYYANNVGLVSLTLPATATLGDTIKIIGIGAGGWKVLQNASQQINMINQSTTNGVGGSLASTNRYDTLELVAHDNNTWTAVSGYTTGYTIV